MANKNTNNEQVIMSILKMKNNNGALCKWKNNNKWKINAKIMNT